MNPPPCPEMSAARFCDRCEAVMKVKTESGKVVFACSSCGESAEGGPWSARLGGADFAERQIHEQTIRNAYGDRTCSRIAAPCPTCGTSTQAFLLLGRELNTFVFCDFCRAYRSGPEAGAEAAAAVLAAEEARAAEAAAQAAAGEARAAAASSFAAAFGLSPP